MAASNAPKNDFAPSWLNFPNQSNSRPSGSKSSHSQDRNNRQQRRDDYYGRYSGDYQRGLNRQNSFEMYDGKRYSPSHGAKYRHHSVEDDYFSYNYPGYGYYPYPPYGDHYPMQFGSQPSLQRRDLKYTPAHPNRFGQMNGSNYPGYNYSFYDFFPSGEGFNSYGSGPHPGANKRSHYARDGRGESKDSKDSDRSSHDGEKDDKLFTHDFPSLNGADDDGDAKTSKNASVGGVWDNPPRSKFEDSDAKSSPAGVYKAGPNKSGSARKGSAETVRTNGGLRDMSPLSSVKSTASREGQSSPTQPMEILSTPRLGRPKPGDKKSQFLKTLRNQDSDTQHATHNGTNHCHHHHSNNNLHKGEDEVEVVMNGFGELHLDQDQEEPSNGSSALSRSMEKEFSFLRSLGWNPNETETEITEDEKREFHQKLDQQSQRNGHTRLLPKAWSPSSLLAPSPGPGPAADQALSSSDTESDQDV